MSISASTAEAAFISILIYFFFSILFRKVLRCPSKRINNLNLKYIYFIKKACKIYKLLEMIYWKELTIVIPLLMRSLSLSMFRFWQQRLSAEFKFSRFRIYTY